MEIRTRISVLALLGKFGAGGPVVVGGETPNDIAAVLLAAAVDLLDPGDSRRHQLAVQVTGRVGELAEDEQLVLLQDPIRREQLQEGLELVVVLGLELLEFLQELDDLIQVAERVVEDLRDVELLAVKVLDLLQHFLGDEVFFGILLLFVAP